MAIQIKRYKDRLGPASVQEAIAGMKYYNCDKAAVITNSYFTKNSKNLALANSCILVDRDKLLDWMVAFQDGRKVPKLL